MKRGRVHSGVFDLRCPAGREPPFLVRVEVPTDEGVLRPPELLTRPVPSSVPGPGQPDGGAPDLDAAFTVLLVSCYSADHDQQVSEVIRVIKRSARVDLVLAIGDQVYLDQPMKKATFEGATDFLRHGLNEFLEDKYWRNWSGDLQLNHGGINGLSEILRVAPVAAIPDDHEYWNNYPGSSPFAAPATMNEGVRKSWGAAAKALYDSYQLAEDGNYDYRIDVDPLSFWMMDNRTFRQENRGLTLQRGQPPLLGGYEKFVRWIDDVIAKRSVPVLVTGPSIVQDDVNRAKGRVTDYNFANFRDYPKIVDQLLRAAAADLPVLLLTGDVHYGRVTKVDVSAGGGAKGYGSRWMYEVISSPTALVNPLVRGEVDMTKVRQTFNPGPSHKFSYERLYPTNSWPGVAEWASPAQKADHVALLRFRRTSLGVNVAVTYHPISQASDVRFKPQPVAPFTLPLRPL